VPLGVAAVFFFLATLAAGLAPWEELRRVVEGLLLH
jgi:hypothetical protein